MKNPNHLFLRLSVLFFVNIAYQHSIIAAEKTIVGKVIDSQTQMGIPYSTVVVPQNNKGIVTDSLGRFSIILNEKDINCLLHSSALGYSNDSLILAEKYLGDSLTIDLNPKPYELDEIAVIPHKYKLLKLGITKIDNKGWWQYGMPGLQRAIYMPNNQKTHNCILSDLNIYIDTAGCPAGPLRVRLYSAIKDEIRPDVDLLNSNVIIRNAVGGEFVKVDLSKYQISFPENGLFVAIEWLFDNESYYYKRIIKRKGKDGKDESFELTGYGPALEITSHNDKTHYLQKLVGCKWKDISENKLRPVIYLTLSQQK